VRSYNAIEDWRPVDAGCVAWDKRGRGVDMRTIFFALAAFLAATPAIASGFDWPAGRKAAIVLTYDDALTSQLDIAAPQLDAAGLRGTFFLNGVFAPADVARWRRLSAEGHELGNHSMFHPCPRAAFAMEPQYGSEIYSITGMLREIGAMNTLLFAIDGHERRTYSVPCSITLAGGVDYTDALRASGLIRFVRSGVPRDAVVSGPAALDPFRVPSRSFPESATAADLIAYVQDVQRSGGMGVFMFHGVGGDYLQVSAEAHLGLVRYLQAHRSEIWVAPFQEVMDRATQVPQGQPK
jgi:peptidoglycan-N-acetylglucosamine deacetylase